MDLDAPFAAADTVRRAQTILEAIVNAVPDLVYVFDLDENQNVFTNREVLQLLGYDPEESRAMGERLFELLHPDDAVDIPRRFELLANLADGEVSLNELRLRHVNGEYRHLRTREVVFARHADGRVKQILGVAEDATEEKTLHARLAASEAEARARASELERERHRFVQILQQLPSGVAVVEAPDGRLSFVNQRAEEIWRRLGAVASDGKTHGWRALDRDGREIGANDYPLARALRGDTVTRELVTFQSDSGERAVAAASATAIRGPDGEITGAVALFADVTEQVALEQRMLRQVEFDKALLAVVSEDLRAPINVIGLSATLARTRTSDERLSELLQRISSNADRVTRMLSDLLDASQARLGGGIPLNRVEIDIWGLIDEVVKDAHAAHPDRVFTCATEGDCTGTWDSQRLTQVFQNLVGNAIRHGRPDGAITVKASGADEHVSVRVHNVGPPIPDELLPFVFEPFRTTERRRARDGHGGLGLGLYIAHSIVTSHGGKVEVSSDARAGTTFVVTLPRHPPGV